MGYQHVRRLDIGRIRYLQIRYYIRLGIRKLDRNSYLLLLLISFCKEHGKTTWFAKRGTHKDDVNLFGGPEQAAANYNSATYDIKGILIWIIYANRS